MSSARVWAELKREHPLPEGENSFHFYTSYQKLVCGHPSSGLTGPCGCPGKPWLHPLKCACGDTQIWFGHCTGCKADR